MILDGNRRWARATGGTTADGHQRGADKISEFLGWCDETHVQVVTLWMLSTDNLSRPADELVPLLGIIEDTVRRLAADGRWKVHPVGALDLLPSRTSDVLKEAAEATADIDGITVNVAVGYGGRHEIADAVRSLLQEHAGRGTSIEELAEILDVEHIAEHLYTKGQPDPDWSSAPRANSGCPASCSGRARTASSTSARRTGRPSGRSTSSGRCGTTS